MASPMFDPRPGREVSIRLRPLPSSDWAIQHYGTAQSTEVSLRQVQLDARGPLTVTAVRLNGVPLRFRVIDATTLMVKPMVPLEGGYLEISFLAPFEPQKGSEVVRSTYPLPETVYGLQAPNLPRERPLP